LAVDHNYYHQKTRAPKFPHSVSVVPSFIVISWLYIPG